jgi:calcineurin-like phosphoesterase
MAKLKKYASIYRHMGREHTLYVRATSFEHAEQIISEAYHSKNVSAIDFDCDITHEEKLVRIRDSYYNGEVEQVVLSIPLP